MWDAILPPEHLKEAIKQVVSGAPVSFVSLSRSLPQMRGTQDFAVNASFILWRGVSDAGIDALTSLHSAGSIFFWLCSPAIYSNTMSRSLRAGEPAWLPTMVFNRAPTAEESRRAVRDYVAEISRMSIAAT
jgi:hypothetical protein